MPKRFTADAFQPTRWQSAQDKAKFANWLVRFVESGCPAGQFPQWAYARLIQTFGFIAHYNRTGFAGTYFQNAQTRLDFVDQMATCWWANSDVEQAVQAWLRQNQVVERYRRAADLEREARERAVLAALQEKYAGRPPSPELMPQPAQLSMLG